MNELPLLLLILLLILPPKVQRIKQADDQQQDSKRGPDAMDVVVILERLEKLGCFVAVGFA